MADGQNILLTPSSIKSLYKAKKRKLNVEKWKDNERKILKQSGKSYSSRNGTTRQAKQAPEAVME